ncbi:hypothetical protein E2C01_050492 [Portunus trituberculatus]|uniref:HTH CENPB-type domain-containing protein n=1 Tax=Portunus trituberculatus TaxID=210409 RepID=A0A5B7G8F0_PORTR|nr:hypothetical protein [Portunus trituberculatus]
MLKSANRVLVKTEQLLQRYLDTMARQNLAVDTREVMDVAKEIYEGVARNWGIQKLPMFLPLKGWFERFTKRHRSRGLRDVASKWEKMTY